MKPQRAATSFNSHKLKELERFHRTEKPHPMTTSLNKYNAWNRRNLFLSIPFNLNNRNIIKEVELVVIPNHLPYILLGLPHCREFELTIDCTNCRLSQKDKNILMLVTNITKKKGPTTLYINNETNLQNTKEKHYDCRDVLVENNIYSDFLDILNNCEHI